MDMEGQEVVSSDDHKLGTVVAERGGSVIVESGHVFKSRHAIPTDFLHEHDGVLRATVGKEVVEESPKVDGDSFDENAVKMHYGLIEVHVVDPDPQDANAETDGLHGGIEPAPSERLRTLGGAGDPTIEGPSGLDPADTSTFAAHPRSHIGVNDRSTKPGERTSDS
jgi:hypothetical protein